jgi:hypothetical protein
MIMTFLAPFILSFVAFLVLAVALFVLLSRLDLLGGRGTAYKTYTFRTRGAKKGGRASGESAVFHSETGGGDARAWYQDEQEGEIITLPETALKKDDQQNRAGK